MVDVKAMEKAIEGFPSLYPLKDFLDDAIKHNKLPPYINLKGISGSSMHIRLESGPNGSNFILSTRIEDLGINVHPIPGGPPDSGYTNTTVVYRLKGIIRGEKTELGISYSERQGCKCYKGSWVYAGGPELSAERLDNSDFWFGIPAGSQGKSRDFFPTQLP
jgi:hypothetical protein